MMEHLFRLQMLLKNFKGYAGGLTERVRAGAMAFADAAGRLTYLPSAQVSKEELVRDIATRDRVAALELRLEPSRNLCINGREWLVPQMGTAGIGYMRRENTFTWIEDVARAQALFNRQLQSDWPRLLDALLQQSHPLVAEISRPLGVGYYWSVCKSEYATDIMFQKASSLAAHYLLLVAHGMRAFASSDVMRVETTINKPEGFGVWRAAEGDPLGEKSWRPLRWALPICTAVVRSVLVPTCATSRR